MFWIHGGGLGSGFGHESEFDGKHYDLSNAMMKYWTNFAKTGNPNGEGLVPWEPVTSENEKRLYLSESKIEMQKLEYLDVIKKNLLKK